MFEIFQYQFMRNALLVSVFIGAACALMGQVIVLRRQANIGDALSHSALAGVAIGVVNFVNPSISSLIATVLAAILLEIIRRLFPRYAEISTAVLMALAVGLAAIFSGFAGSGQSFQSYLFGSIVAISESDKNITLAISLLVIVMTFLFYKELFFINFDKRSARLAGVKTSLVEIIFTILIALTIGIAARTVGTLVISSLLVLPFATAMQLHLNYKHSLIASVIISVLNASIGIILSYYLQIAPGGAIVVFSVLVLFIVSAVAKAVRLLRAKARERSTNE